MKILEANRERITHSKIPGQASAQQDKRVWEGIENGGCSQFLGLFEEVVCW